MSPSVAPLTSEADILTAAVGTLTERMPSDWRADIQREAAAGRYRADAVVTITAPGGARATLYAEVKRSVVTRDLPAMVEQAQSYIDTAASPRREGAKPLLVARYLAPQLQLWLTERDIPYADAAGNIRVSLSEPALFVRDVGAQRDPWRGPGRPKGNLTGASAARVVRALVDFGPPYTVPGLMKLAGTPSGNTYRAVDFIEEQDLLTRADDGKITDVRWRELLERWSKDYSFAKLAAGSTYLAPRGLPDLMERLAGLAEDDEAGQYAVTGSLATPKWEAYAPARNAMIYSEKPDELAACADLRRVDAGANVLIARAADPAAFDRTQRLDGVVIVSPSQAAVDLLTAPGRGPEEARALLDWMEKNESAWRQ
ncbi:MAG: type IV toxin-antitoxin system AbiEi family antitoxin [Jatrophihabitantaceae bacterium]